eukprot:14802147-Alexandrium_andersonii.AAC.1
MNPLCSSALSAILRPGQRSRGANSGVPVRCDPYRQRPTRASVSLRRPAGRGGDVPTVTYGERE